MQFELQEWLLINTYDESAVIESCDDDGNGGLNLEIKVYTDEMVTHFKSEEELLSYLFNRMLEDDGQIVRFCDLIVRNLAASCSRFYYDNTHLIENDIFEDDSAEYNIPKVISEIAERLHIDVKEQIELEDKEFQDKENE